MTEATSLSLLDRVANCSDTDAWDRLAGVYTPLMRQWLDRYEVQSADADDLIQEVLAYVMQELPRFDHNQRTGAFRNWLRKILVNRLRNFWRGRKGQPAATGTTSLLEQLNQLEDDTSRLSRIWNEQHDREVVTRLMELVRPRFQAKTWEAFHRQMFDSQKPDRIAAELDMELGSVYMARNRVLTALRREAAGLVDSL